MNIETTVANEVARLESIVASAKATISKIKRAQTTTLKVLEAADHYKVAKVGINRGLGDNGWSFISGPSSVFTHKDDRVDRWPAAWRIVERAGISGGCGNTGQHQINTTEVIDGVYVCTDGIWTRIPDDEAHDMYLATRAKVTGGAK